MGEVNLNVETAEDSRRTNIKATAFLEQAWKVKSEDGGHAEIAAHFDVSKQTVASKLSSLRNRKDADGNPLNIQVPDFPRGGGGGARLDVDALNAIAAKYQQESA